MTIKPFFSLITVTKNNLVGLKNTARSIDKQNLDDYEWIIIDGASIDGTTDFLAGKKAQWISEPDSSLYEAMNKGILRALGTYSLFLNAGDELADDNTLAAICERADRHPDFIYGDAYEAGFYKTAQPVKKIIKGMITHHQAMIYKTALLKHFRYDLRYHIAADYDLTWRFLQKAGTFLSLSLPICRFEPGGVSQQQSQAGRREEYMIRRRAGVSGVTAQWIYTRQAASSLLKEKAPRTYWALRRSLSTAR